MFCACTPEPDGATNETSSTGGETSTTGDGGDGDGGCECPGAGPFDQCPAQPFVSNLYSAAPLVDFDDTCTVLSTITQDSTVVSLDCPSVDEEVAVEVAGPPVWSPPLGEGDEVRLRMDSSPGMAEGDDWAYVSWRIDRASDGRLLSSYVAGEYLALFDDEPATEVHSGLCPKTCGPESDDEVVAVSFAIGEDEAMLFPGESASIDGLEVFLGRAVHRSCMLGDDIGPGDYQVLVTATTP